MAMYGKLEKIREETWHILSTTPSIIELLTKIMKYPSQDSQCLVRDSN
jgi:hypothetical protein